MVYEGLSKNIVSSSFKQSVLVWGRRDSWESLTKRHWNDSSCFPTWFNQNISTTISRYQQTCGFKWWYYDTFWIPLLFNLAMVHLRWIVDDGTNTWQEDYHRVTNQHVWSCRNGRYLFAYTLYKHTSQNCWVADISRAWSIGLWAYGSGPWSIKPFNNHGDLGMVTLNIHPPPGGSMLPWLKKPPMTWCPPAWRRLKKPSHAELLFALAQGLSLTLHRLAGEMPCLELEAYCFWEISYRSNVVIYLQMFWRSSLIPL